MTVDIDGRTSLHVLVEEATRQLTICNSCRYCEGLCAVFPALERRSVLGSGDISQLANLCHDCRACFDACMYDPPHEFALDVPKVLSAVRVRDYQRYVWPRSVPRVFAGWSGIAVGALAAIAVVLIAAVAHVGWPGLVQDSGGAASPYDLVPYPLLLTLMLCAGAFAVIVTGFAARTFWRATATANAPVTAAAVARAVWYALTLRYLRGGGGGCPYPDDERPSPGRRIMHSLLAYGFGLCLVSTIAAGIEQDVFAVDPPYPALSVPVITGTFGGLMLVAGCCGLLVLKTRSSQVTSFRQMTIKDYGLLSALSVLGLTGLAVLFTRSTPAFGLVLAIHLAAVIQSFAMAPYSKFVHLVFRFEALVRDVAESEAARS